MQIEDKYLMNEAMKNEIKSIHYWVKREIEEVEALLKDIPMDYEFKDHLLRNTHMEITKHFDDVKAGLGLLRKVSKSKMVFKK